MLERVRIGGFRGTYKVRSAELARDKKTQTKAVTVLFLDESTYTFQLDKKAKGSDLLELVFQHLELSERDYFGLQFKPKCRAGGNGTSSSGNNNNNGTASSASGGSTATSNGANVPVQGEPGRWLDPNKPFRKQWSAVRLSSDIIPMLSFRVKFYVTDPSRLHEEYTRYQFYLQIKRDIFQGKLPIGLNTACLLASYTVQCKYFIRCSLSNEIRLPYSTFVFQLN